VHAISGEAMSSLFSKQTSAALPYRLLKLALVPNDRAVLHERIALRFDQMLEAGFLDEVRALLVKYPTLTQDATSMRCVGYRQALEHLAGDYELAELRDRGIFATRQLAKRQLTWLRGMTDSLELDCLQSGLQDQVLQVIKQHL